MSGDTVTKSYRVTLCQHNYQMSALTSFVFYIWQLSTRLQYSSEQYCLQFEIHRSGNTDSFILTLSARAFLGAWARGGWGRKVLAAYNSKTIHGIKMKFGRVVENDKLINLVLFNWQMTS